MRRPKFLHELLAALVENVNFVISYETVTNNGDGTFTLNEICDFHHAQPGMSVTIGGKSYVIVDYDTTAKTLQVKGTDTISVLTFDLYEPKFFHGTPIQQETELTKIKTSDKTPMIYLIEPYKQVFDTDALSAIDRTVDCSICFLTQADISRWLTEDFYHNSITPMKNLFEDFLIILKESNLFYSALQKASPVYHTKFGINLKAGGTNQLLFSEKLSGLAVDISLQIYKDDSCGCGDGQTFIQRDLGEYLQIS